jgi:hypothetical protein
MVEPKSADIAYGEVSQLEELIDRDSLREVCRSFFDLFGLSIRIFSARGVLLASVHEERSICRYVNSLTRGRVACSETVAHAQMLVPTGSGTVEHPCFTGAVYHIVPIRYDERSLGRIVLGPFLPAEVNEVPNSLISIDPKLEPERARVALLEMPRVREQTATRIAQHLGGVLDLILFSGHKAQLTSAMHLATVRENYRELGEKNTRLQAQRARPTQVELSGHGQPRAAHAAHVDHRLFGDAGSRHRGRVEPGASRLRRDHPHQG